MKLKPKSLLWLAVPILFIGLIIFVVHGWNATDAWMEKSTCDELLKSIQKNGTVPNYQYDVRAWIAKECWK